MNVISIRRAEDDSDKRPPEEDQGAQLKGLYAIALRRWRAIAAVAIVVFAGVIAFTLTSPKIYTATALVMVNPGQSQVLAQDQMVENAAPSSAAVDSEIEVLRSQLMAENLVASMRLDEDPEWNALLRPVNPISAALAAIGGSQPRPDQETQRLAVARDVAEAISVRRRGLSYGIEVSVDAQDPARAALMANQLVVLYLETQTAARFDASMRANQWLGGRLDELGAEVQQKERAADQFRMENGLSTAAGGDANLQSQTPEVQTMLVQARADLAEKQARLRQVQEMMRAGGSAESIGTALNSQTISELRSREADTAQRLAELRQRYSAEHPTVMAAESELENIRQRIGDEVGRITANLQNEVQVAQARLGTLEGSFGAASGARDENNEAVIRYRELLRDAAAARAVQESFMQRAHEVADQGEMPIATSRLVSRATPPPSPSKPNMQSALLLALLLGALAGLGVGYLLEILDASVSNAEDAERKLGATALASIPVLKPQDFRGLAPHRHNPADYLVDKPMSGFAEALRVMRTALMHARLERKPRVIAITSAIPDEGKTTMSLCLARIAAMSGQNVVLVDCDLRRRSLSETINVPAQTGLLEVLSGQGGLRQSIQQDPESGAHILPTLVARFTPKDVFSSPAMTRLLEELKQNYDLVILDCAPVLAVAETRTIAALADMAVVVVRSEKTPAAAVKTALRELNATGADVAGVTLNYVNPRRPGHGAYGDSLYYRHAKSYYHN